MPGQGDRECPRNQEHRAVQNDSRCRLHKVQRYCPPSPRTDQGQACIVSARHEKSRRIRRRTTRDACRSTAHEWQHGGGAERSVARPTIQANDPCLPLSVGHDLPHRPQGRARRRRPDTAMHASEPGLAAGPTNTARDGRDAASQQAVQPWRSRCQALAMHRALHTRQGSCVRQQARRADTVRPFRRHVTRQHGRIPQCNTP